MNIQKLFSKISFSLAAFFWAGCSSDSSTPPLYGVEPTFDSSSSTVTSSGGCEQGCDEMVSSSSEIAKVDSAAAFKRGEELCAEQGGLKESMQYQTPWMSASMAADQDAYEQVQDSVAVLLESDSAASFSEKKKSCLEIFKDNFRMIALYGAPFSSKDNPNDVWTYTCNNGDVIDDEAMQKLKKEYNDEYEAAMKKYLTRYRIDASKCDD